MRGELDDALARMARMEELQRRLANGAPRDLRASGEPAQQDRPPTDQRYEPHPPVDPAVRPWSAVDDVVEAVRLVVGHHPQLAVTLWAEDGTTGAAVRVEWVDGVVTVTPDEEPVAMPSAGAPPPSYPMTVQPRAQTPTAWTPPTEEGANASAARLAEMIRRNPSLLRAD
ncbi:hypothetical protein ACFQ0D_33420, partial [Micromonospora zhanjiangensis]